MIKIKEHYDLPMTEEVKLTISRMLLAGSQMSMDMGYGHNEDGDLGEEDFN